MTEGPLGHVSALLPCRFVRKAEVDPLPDPGVDHLFLHIRKTAVEARVQRSRPRIGSSD